ncbi:hypothetical protein BZG36_01647 [Bifiguratus adelaidae]|uniref:mannan endo-1,4-beta-mannosidase n=1 Tax=Bifiguratus adelaidae TaxID=1938954 RepID=A0A261Y4C4_9FUNG|nr:hypothetical protein BZG36_01647 [Bifiguratus adelaidae]
MRITDIVAALGALASVVNASPAHHRRGKPSDFVTVEGTHFALHGKPFYFAGANTYYLFYAQPSDVDADFAALNSIDGLVLRTWAWSEGEQGMSTGVWYQNYNASAGGIVYNDSPQNGLGRLDYVIDSARRHNVKLILTLTGNWVAFGGIDWYNQVFNSTYHDDFYTKPAIQEAYKNWMSHILNHKSSITGIVLKDDPTIMAFELANEPRCGGSQVNNTLLASPSCGPATITNWVKIMSAYFKSIDKNHLLAVGDEGFFNHPNGPSYTGTYSNIWDGTAGTDFEAFTATPDIDFGSVHSYMDSWNTPHDPQWLNNTLTWIAEHVQVANKIGKPVVLGEWGTTNKTMRLSDMPVINKEIESSGMAGDLYWMLADMYNGSFYPDYDGYTIYANDTNIKTLVTDHAKIMSSRNKGRR